MSDLTQVILAFACLLNAAAVMGLVRRVKALESKPKQSASYNISVPGRKEGP